MQGTSCRVTIMSEVWIYAPMRHLTGGQERVQADGSTVRQVIESLERQFPGMRDALRLDDDLMPGIAVIVDGETSALGLLEQVGPESELHFLPAIGGG